VRNTNAFIDRAFNGVHNSKKFGVLCPCSECGNRVRQRRAVITIHLCKRGFTPGYTIWTKHGEQPYREPTLEHANDTVDGLIEMLADFGDAMHTDDLEVEPTADAKALCVTYIVKLQSVAFHTGMPATEVPRPLPPPPQPPIYAVLQTPNPSHGNVSLIPYATFSSIFPISRSCLQHVHVLILNKLQTTTG
jgi:hypothetical protein